MGYGIWEIGDRIWEFGGGVVWRVLEMVDVLQTGGWGHRAAWRCRDVWRSISLARA
jgi:hypothetical protein